LRRHDYAVDVLGGAKGAYYIGDYNDNSGTAMPHRNGEPIGTHRRLSKPTLMIVEDGDFGLAGDGRPVRHFERDILIVIEDRDFHRALL
jgi:hypothetical protein